MIDPCAGSFIVLEVCQELKRELENKKQELMEHVRQSEEKRNSAKRELYSYIEQRTNY